MNVSGLECAEPLGVWKNKENMMSKARDVVSKHVVVVQSIVEYRTSVDIILKR